MAYIIENITERAEKEICGFKVVAAVREDNEDNTGYRLIVTLALDHERTTEQCIEEIEDAYPEKWCHHDHDCCGGWYSRRPTFFNAGYNTLVVVFSHYQNV